MAIIYSYPEISLTDIRQDDRFVISKMSEATNPTKSISIGTLASYVATKITSVTGVGLTGYILKWVDGPNGVAGDSNLIDDTTRIVCNQDFQLKPDGVGVSSGSKSLIFSGIDDVGTNINAAKIFTTDSTINPSGQDLYIQNADDNGVLRTGLFIDAFQQVAIGKGTATAQLDVGGSGNFDTSLVVGTDVKFSDYGSGTRTGTAAYNLAVDASGQVIETPSGSGGVSWPNQYSAISGTLLQGENPSPAVGANNTSLGTGAGKNMTALAANNTLIGKDAGLSITDGFALTLIGVNAGSSFTTGGAHTAIGFNALQTENTEQGNTTAIGYDALKLQNGPGVTMFNTAIGGSAGSTVTTGNSNTLIGYQAGFPLTTGDKNIAIGFNARVLNNSDDNSITIGNDAIGNGTDTITLGNSNHTTVVLPGGLINAVDDTAAAAAGVPINGLYRNVNAIQIRLV
tara:strand:+ start:525 stop:1892 length:1368 start_codon:yes stop_codon:yes gene_type:complete